MPSIRRPGENGWHGPPAGLHRHLFRWRAVRNAALDNGLVTTGFPRHPDARVPRTSGRDRVLPGHGTAVAGLRTPGGEVCAGRPASRGESSDVSSRPRGSASGRRARRCRAFRAIAAVRPAWCGRPCRGGPGGYRDGWHPCRPRGSLSGHTAGASRPGGEDAAGGRAGDRPRPGPPVGRDGHLRRGSQGQPSRSGAGRQAGARRPLTPPAALPGAGPPIRPGAPSTTSL